MIARIMDHVEWSSLFGGVAVVSSGLISGQMLAIALSKHAASRLPEENWTRSFQVENRLFTKTMPPALMTPLLTLAASCLLAKGDARLWYVSATAMTAIVFAITMIANVPINKQVAGWRPGAAPAAWTSIRDRWLSYHDLRTAFGVLAVIFAVIAVSLH